MVFNVSETAEWVQQHKNVWNEVQLQLFEKLATDPIKGEDKYMDGKLKMWEKTH